MAAHIHWLMNRAAFFGSIKSVQQFADTHSGINTERSLRGTQENEALFLIHYNCFNLKVQVAVLGCTF